MVFVVAYDAESSRFRYVPDNKKLRGNQDQFQSWTLCVLSVYGYIGYRWQIETSLCERVRERVREHGLCAWAPLSTTAFKVESARYILWTP